jgi:hypothetical protein
VHRTLRAFAHDLLHGVLHFEGKIFRTLPKLLFRPGELTRRYIAGERARFVSPLALFLFSVFAMFAVISLLGSPLDVLDEAGRADASAAFQVERNEIESRLQKLRQDRATAGARGVSTATLDENIREDEIALQVLRELGGDDDTIDPRDGGGHLKVGGKTVVGEGTVGDGDTSSKAGNPGRAESALQSSYSDAYKAAKKNPKLLIYKLQTNAYKFSWALIILSVPFMALLFLWRWRPLYDHAVFITYSITTVSIVVITGSLLVLAGLKPGAVLVAGTLFIPWHMYRQLRGGYELRRFSALWRTAALLFFASLALIMFAFGLLMLGVLG